MAQVNYYYAGGEKVLIELDEDRVAVDLGRLEVARPEADHWIALIKRGRPLKGTVYIVERSRLPDEAYTELDRLAALHPVYHHGTAILVILPEVRVEITSAHRPRLRSFVEKSPVGAAITQEDGDKVVLRPLSGKGADAITLANAIYEVVHPRMAQARFLRMVPRPDRSTRAA